MDDVKWRKNDVGNTGDTVVIRYQEALSKIVELGNQNAENWEHKRVSLAEAFGSVLAESVLSVESFPMFEASTVDGFALRAAETKGAGEKEVRFNVSHHIHAGGNNAGKVETGHAVGVSTGGVLPAEANVVVKIEDVVVHEKSPNGMPAVIGIRRELIAGDGIRYRGTDVRAKQVILEKGTRLDYQHFPLLTALGVRELCVQRRVRVGVVSTGDEIVDWNTSNAGESGKIRNATGAFLAVTLQGMGCDLLHYSTVGDDGASYRKALQEAMAAKCDVVVTTGAVSMGPKDFVAPLLQQMGAEIVFHRIAMKPGKPALCARFATENGACMVFGLPGNPLSTAVGLRFLVTPYLQTLLGTGAGAPIPVKLGNDVVKPEGLRTFLLGTISKTKDGVRVFSPAEQESFRVLPFARSNVWIVLPEVGAGVAMGDLVEVLPLFDEGNSRQWPVGA